MRLFGPSARKSIQPIAALLAAGEYDQLHNSLTTGAWDAAPVAAALIRQATRLLGGPDAALIIDDTTLLRTGPAARRRPVSPPCGGRCSPRYSPNSSPLPSPAAAPHEIATPTPA